MEDTPQPEELQLGDSFAQILTETTQSLVCVLDRGGRLIAWSNRLMGDTGLVTTGIDLTDRESNRDSALEGDPEAKLIEVSRVANEHKALRRVATLVASETSPERIFDSVSAEVARVLQVNATAVVRYVGDGTAEMVGRHNRDSANVLPLGTKLPMDDDSALAQVARTS